MHNRVHHGYGVHYGYGVQYGPRLSDGLEYSKGHKGGWGGKEENDDDDSLCLSQKVDCRPVASPPVIKYDIIPTHCWLLGLVGSGETAKAQQQGI